MPLAAPVLTPGCSTRGVGAEVAGPATQKLGTVHLAGPLVSGASAIGYQKDLGHAPRFKSAAHEDYQILGDKNR